MTLRRSSFVSQVLAPTPCPMDCHGPRWEALARRAPVLEGPLLLAGTMCSSWAEVDVFPLVTFFHMSLASLMAHPSFRCIPSTAHPFSWPHDRG